MTGKLQAHEGGAHCWKAFFIDITPPPLFSCPLPMHTQIQFSYIFSTAYRVIVETYAHCCADMCAGPGSTGRVRDTWCTEKMLLIPLLLSFFLPFSFSFPTARMIFSLLTLCIVLPTFSSTALVSSKLIDPHFSSSVSQFYCPHLFCLVTLQSALRDLPLFLLLPLPCFPPFPLSFTFFTTGFFTVGVLKQAQRAKDVFKENKSPWQLHICLGPCFWANSIPPICITLCSACLTFSQLPRFNFPSLFFPYAPSLLPSLTSFSFPWFLQPLSSRSLFSTSLTYHL